MEISGFTKVKNQKDTTNINHTTTSIDDLKRSLFKLAITIGERLTDYASVSELTLKVTLRRWLYFLFV